MKEMQFAKMSDDDLEQVAGGFGQGNTISSGSFASSTGTALNLLVYWSVRADGAGMKTLDVSVCATSYSLFCTGSYGGVELTVNGMTYVSSTHAIEYGGNTPTTNTLATFSIPNISGAVNVTAVWHFNGTYSNTPIGDIRASGTVVA